MVTISPLTFIPETQSDAGLRGGHSAESLAFKKGQIDKDDLMDAKAVSEKRGPDGKLISQTYAIRDKVVELTAEELAAIRDIQH